jgi:hypothetical protein
MGITTPDQNRHPIAYSALRRFVSNYEWIHTGLGLMGNLAFLVGSILFLSESTKHIGTWLFIVGASGMLIGSIGRAIVDAAEDGG